MKYKVGIVSGKFRLLHVGHKEVIIKASKEDIEALYVIAHVNEEYKRYSTVEQLVKAIEEILNTLDKKTKLILTYDKYENIQSWEEFVIQEVGHNNILMFNSKEAYHNIKLDNKFINCECSIDISATDIEHNLDKIEYQEQIAEEFIPFLKVKD